MASTPRIPRLPTGEKVDLLGMGGAGFCPPSKIELICDPTTGRLINHKAFSEFIYREELLQMTQGQPSVQTDRHGVYNFTGKSEGQTRYWGKRIEGVTVLTYERPPQKQ